MGMEKRGHSGVALVGRDGDVNAPNHKCVLSDPKRRRGVRDYSGPHSELCVGVERLGESPNGALVRRVYTVL